ncbi:MAG: DUF6488 family protein [Sulfurovum sp.]|nr:DUF6488 family protein [Sulfurovum sp.]
MIDLKKPIKITVLTLALSLTSLYSESTHGHGHAHHDNPFKHEVSKKTIEKAAIKEVQSLVAKKKIPQSWKHVPISKIGKTHYGDTDDWVVGFDNMKIKNKKDKCFIYL